MAINTDRIPIIEAALDSWRDWSSLKIAHGRPQLGSLIGEGTSNRVYKLHSPDQRVLRYRHKSHNLSVNEALQEIAIWKFLANVGLAPKVYYHSDGGDVVITDHLIFSDISQEEHAHLLRRIHGFRPGASRLVLTHVAETYRAAIGSANAAELTIDPQAKPIRRDLALLDSEPPVFCHTDLSSRNIGRLGEKFLAIDWEYASMGSQHFDVASASEGMEHNTRLKFAVMALENTFNDSLWAAACRAVPLINYLWAMATANLAIARSLQETIEESYTR